MFRPLASKAKSISAVALAAGVLLLLAPATAHAAVPEKCESGLLAAPLQSVPLYDTPTGGRPVGQFSTPLCAVTGVTIPNEVVSYAPGAVEVEIRGSSAFVEETYVSLYPLVQETQLNQLFVVVDSKGVVDGGLLGEAGKVSNDYWAVPGDGGPLATKATVEGVQPGTALLSTSDPDLYAWAQAGLSGEQQWQPVLFEPGGEILWGTSVYLEPLPTADDRFTELEIDSAGFLAYGTPLDKSPIAEVKRGTTLQVTSPVEGWSLVSDGTWLKHPANVESDSDDDGSGTWENLKAHAADAWNTSKEKAGELSNSASEKASSVAEDSKALTFGRMLSSAVLSGLAILLALASILLRPARGLASVTPAGIARTIGSYGGAVAAAPLPLAAVSVAPWAWIWPPILAIAAGIISAFSLFVSAARVRGGVTPPDQASLMQGLRSPLAIAGGLVTAASTIGGLAAAGGNWVAYIVAGVMSASVYAGFALVAPKSKHAGDDEPGPADDPTAPQPEEGTTEAAEPDAETTVLSDDHQLQ